MTRKLITTWTMALIMSFLLPVVSFAAVSATMLDYQQKGSADATKGVSR